VNRGTTHPPSLRLPAAAAGSDLNINACCSRMCESEAYAFTLLALFLAACIGGGDFNEWSLDRTHCQKKRFKDPRTHLACTIDRQCTHCFRQVRALQWPLSLQLSLANNASAAATASHTMQRCACFLKR
jgi:hypothetical protein